jgi:hypothetical protein
MTVYNMEKRLQHLEATNLMADFDDVNFHASEANYRPFPSFETNMKKIAVT